MSAETTYADWIAVDWGTSRLRVWAMGRDGTVRARAASDEGMGGLDRDGFEPALLQLIEPWLGTGIQPVMACGMVGSRQGWAEVPYETTPCTPTALRPMAVPTQDARIRLFIMPGVSQASPVDVMRGEETQISGFLVEEPSFDGVVCLPGTHTKWVHISAGEVVSFQTFMTGEMFQFLSEHSVLRHGIAADGTDETVFAETVSDAISRPEKMAQRLFSIRAEGILQGLTPQAARARLSGALIGAELAAARPYWLGQQVVVAGAPGLTALYSQALGAQGVDTRVLDAGPLTLMGLGRAYATISETIS
ncbi:2-dehydro-3-deoxygalactonokinase [Rhodophyticola sp. CCM32]|uniref:2-dehydro-3-deoxygalactonokinase n=1 Tax=Rhodophyticola sp. CCM32 TaxID=2916397 RepID=UPI00107F8648|nr:2-dehydro-3-deoxygalactonokinase [Rhodophyticola sp. CCM32]QBY01577.1 2-dehydro-3-deoxygalactonokinase [Rhodophyticola sp. CCM32]